MWLSTPFREWNIEEFLPRITCPVVAIQGLDDEYGTLEQIERIARACAAVSVVKLDQCRHSPHRGQPVRVLEHVSGWLRGMKDTQCSS